MTTHSIRRLRTFIFVSMVLAVVAFVPASTLDAQTSLPAFSKAFSPSTIGPGSVSTLRFDITNSTGSPIRNLAFTDSLPAGMTIASPANASSTCLGLIDAPNGGSVISFSGGGIGASTTCSISVNVTISTPGTHTNTSGDLTSDAGNSGPATADLTVATDRPGFTKSFSPSSVFFGGRSTLTLTIDNSANPALAANLTFIDSLPSGMVVANPSNAAKTCTGGTLTAPAGGTSIAYAPSFFTDATVAAGGTCTVSVDVIGNSVGNLGNITGELSSTTQFGGASRSSGKASAILSVSIEQIALTKSFLDDPAAPGGTVTLEFTARNLDRRSDATDIAFTDDLDAVLSGLTAIGLPANDVCGSGSQISGTSVITLTGGNLAPEGTCTFSVLVQIPAAAPSGSFLNTTSAITATIGGVTATGDPASDLLFVDPVPILTKTFTDDPVGAGGSVNLEFSITNTSATDEATDITFEDVFNVILPTASATPADGFCGAGSTATYTPLIDPPGQSAIPAKLVVSGASLGAGETCTFAVTLDVALGAATGIYPNVTGEITATVGKGTVTGNPASDDLEVVAAPNLEKEFVDDPVVAGGTVTLEFTLSHDETAPGDATGINFSDDLDATLSGLVATGLPANDICGTGSTIDGTSTLLFSGGSLAPGESCTFSVTLQTPASAASGIYPNTTSAIEATVLGISTMEIGASDDLTIAGLMLAKEFTNDPVLAGATVNLRYTITNESATENATDISFQDNLDQAVNNMAALGLPVNDVCGTGSSLTGLSGGEFLLFTGGTLAPGESCTFDVTVQVPAATEPETYSSTTQLFFATINGSMVVFANASDELVVTTDALALTKEFLDDPVAPGDTVTLRFTVTNTNSTGAVSDIAFTDDLGAALAGLTSTSGTVADVCGVGSQVSGSNVLSVTGGNLAAGASCSFDVVLTVPTSVSLGTIVNNVTSSVTGSLGGLAVTGAPASDMLQIDFVAFSKAFGGSADPGDVVTLSFTIENLSTSSAVGPMNFIDDLSQMFAGLEAIGLPLSDVCGEGSTLSGTSFLALSEGRLLPGGSCTFSVDLQVPATAPPGSYLNATSNLTQDGIRIADPATDKLIVLEPPVDDDGDGVLNGDDLCPGTVIPEGVPTVTLRPNRHALVDGDLIFDTQPPPGGGNGPGETFTTTDTAGCSCEQIIEALELGNGHRKFGCSLSAMRDWVAIANGTDDKVPEREPTKK